MLKRMDFLGGWVRGSILPSFYPVLLSPKLIMVMQLATGGTASLSSSGSMSTIPSHFLAAVRKSSCYR